MLEEELKPFEIGQLLGDIKARLGAIEMKLNAALASMTDDVKELGERVRILEDDRLKTRTFATIVGVIGGFVAQIVITIIGSINPFHK
jgi:hypothetical protein